MTNVHQLSTLEQVTCYAIIIALVLAVIKQFHYPLSRLTRFLNPWRNRNIVDGISNRLEDCEMEKYNQDRINIEIKKRLRKIEKNQRHQRLKDAKKNESTN